MPRLPLQQIPNVYSLKSWPPYFWAVVTGQKRAEMRTDDRGGFSVGDLILLREYLPSKAERDAAAGDGELEDEIASAIQEVLDDGPSVGGWHVDESPHGIYTGRTQPVRVTHILSGGWGLEPGYVLLSIDLAYIESTGP